MQATKEGGSERAAGRGQEGGSEGTGEEEEREKEKDREEDRGEKEEPGRRVGEGGVVDRGRVSVEPPSLWAAK